MTLSSASCPPMASTSLAPAASEAAPMRNVRPTAKTPACLPCRFRKIKCNGALPGCSTCLAANRPCEYDENGPKRRNRVEGSRRDRQDKKKAAAMLQAQKAKLYRDRTAAHGMPDSFTPARDTHDCAFKASSSPDTADGIVHHPPPREPSPVTSFPSQPCDTQTTRNPSPDIDVSQHVIRNPTGAVEVRGPTNTLYESPGSDQGSAGAIRLRRPDSADAYSAASAFLTKNALRERENEVGYRQTLLEQGTIDGVRAELALHLLDIHFNRHHFFCITYRPVFFRDMVKGGRFYSPLLLYALMAVTCRYSERDDPEVGGGNHADHSGQKFYEMAEELLRAELGKSSIPTATALLIMGNALMSAGQVDRGWDYTGRGIRMITQLGLYVEDDRITANAPPQALEHIEVSRRLFWGAFVSEKLQSLYLGRPIFMHGRDCHVPKKFMDVSEEDEMWHPFLPVPNVQLPPMATNGISNFIEHCALSEICEEIMSSFYQVHAGRTARDELRLLRERIRGRLRRWEERLQEKLRFEPWKFKAECRPMHTMVLHTIYQSLVILTERPFVLNGHLKSGHDYGDGWRRCTAAAEKIAHILDSYRECYSFRRVPYQLCYATYVASTILVRNATGPGTTAGRDVQLYLGACLRGFGEMKLAHQGAERMQSRIDELMTRLNVHHPTVASYASGSQLPHFQDQPPHLLLTPPVALLPDRTEEYQETVQAATGELSHTSLPFAAGPYTTGLPASMAPCVPPESGDYDLMNHQMAEHTTYMVPPTQMTDGVFAGEPLYYFPMPGDNVDLLFGPAQQWG